MPDRKISTQRACQQCGELFTVAIHNQEFCGNACKMRAYRARTLRYGKKHNGDQIAVTSLSAATAGHAMEQEIDLEWGDPFPPVTQSKPCIICNEEFYPGAVRQRLCSAGCRRHAYLERMRTAKMNVEEGCLRCGEKFMRKKVDESPFCGMFCKWIFWHQTPERDHVTVN